MLEDLKILLGIQADDRDRDDLLNTILSGTRARLKSLLGGIEPPVYMDYIVTEVAVIRFNRIGSEGASSHTVEGESVSFNSDDFAPFMPEIESFLSAQKDGKRGRVRFL